MHYAAILGFGTVGSGVAEALSIDSDALNRKTDGITLKYIVDVRDFPDSPFAGLMTKDFSTVENDPDVDMVVETIGGVGIAREFTRRALAAGKSVITSNKELVATHGCELMALAEEHGVSYLFEASVGGGIPMLRTIAYNLGAEKITEFFGILNGTTNYILTQMFRNGMSFSAALARAKELGYSEADPTADIDGIDACRKVAILCSIITGWQMPPEKISVEGISGVSVEDVEFAASMGCTIRLLGHAFFERDGRVRACVAPHLIPAKYLLSGVEDVMNGLHVRAEALGDMMLYGAGAGKLPTASAIVSDMFCLAGNRRDGAAFAWGPTEEERCGSASDLPFAWYVRMAPAEGWEEKQNGLHLFAQKDGKYGYYTDEMTEEALLSRFAGQVILSRFRIIR